MVTLQCIRIIALLLIIKWNAWDVKSLLSICPYNTIGIQSLQNCTICFFLLFRFIWIVINSVDQELFHILMIISSEPFWFAFVRAHFEGHMITNNVRVCLCAFYARSCDDETLNATTTFYRLADWMTGFTGTEKNKYEKSQQQFNNLAHLNYIKKHTYTQIVRHTTKNNVLFYRLIWTVLTLNWFGTSCVRTRSRACFQYRSSNYTMF